MELEISYLTRTGTFGLFVKMEKESMEFWFDSRIEREIFAKLIRQCISINIV